MWQEKLAQYDKLVAMHSAFERKGKTMPYTSANGHMFSLLNKAGELGIRLPKASAEKFMETYQSTRFKSHGAFMRDYVRVPDNLLEDLETLSPYLAESYAYVMSLPPK